MLKLYTETTIEVKPTTPAARLEFQIARKNGSYNKSKHTTRPQRGDTLASDEKSFADQYLASASSVYFRRTKTYPRTFLWRVIADKRILEVKCVDLARPEKDQKEAYLTLSFEFQDAILPLGVAFADPTNAEELHAFVCTDKNELFNLRLSTDFFRSAASIPQNVEDWCKPLNLSAFSIDTIYNIYASSPFEIFVAFTGGRILAARRKTNGETWSQEYYDDASWVASIRGLVVRRGPQAVEYGKNQITLTTPQGIVASPDTTYLYTLCLNHTLRIWHLPTGKLVDSRDLLNVARESSERMQLSPAEPGLIRLVRFSMEDSQTLVTYSPYEGGQFKFWSVKGGLTTPLKVQDRFPNTKLSPPDPDPTGNTVWSMTGLEIVPDMDNRGAQIWVLWRNNNYHQIYTIHLDVGTLTDDWKTNWVATEPSLSRHQALDFVALDSVDVTEKWLRFVLFPGRYATAVLETALIRYQDITGFKLQSSMRDSSLQERLCAIIASSVSLRKYDEADMDYERFNVDTDHQWRNFWRIVENINEGRYAPLAIAFDTFTGMAWMTQTDLFTAIRECSKQELVQHNMAEEIERSEEVVTTRWQHRRISDSFQLLESMSRILDSARRFRKSFSPDLAYEFVCAVEEEMFTTSEISTPERIVLIFNQVGFSEGLSEGAEQQLSKDLEPFGGIDGLSNDLVEQILELLMNVSKNPKSSLRRTLFGTQVLSSALLDDVLLTKDALLDLLVLTVFVDESPAFDPPELFEQVLVALTEQERNLWLLTHSRPKPTEFLGAAGKPIEHDPIELTRNNGRAVSMMEDIFMKSFRPQPAVDKPMMYLLTDMVAETHFWARGTDVVTGEDAVVHIQCFLLAHDEIDLATNFLRFQPASPLSIYVKGRLRLVKGQHAEAALYFRKAAYTLACGKAIAGLKEMSAGLLSLLDAEHFNNGMPRYFQHVMSLFEGKKAYVQTAEFARLALQALGPNHQDPVPNFRSEILSRLFTSELKCGKFEAAYETLVQFPNTALQKSAAVMLVASILDPKISAVNASGGLAMLQRLPWSLHPHLSSHIDQHLTVLAKKQSSIPESGTQWMTSSTVDYLSILHALRLSKNDYRGATAVLFDRLRIIQRSGRARTDPRATSMRHALLALINAMTCVAPDEAYILADVDDDPRIQGLKRTHGQQDQPEQKRKRKRMIITLDDLRRDYQQILDRCSRIERGDFDFEDANGDVSDEDDEEHQVNGSRLHGDAMEL